jgi:glyceraldehyde-3-phosphate dehydrogenase (NADP+)
MVLAGESVVSTDSYQVTHPHDGSVVAEVSRATPGDCERAIGAAGQAFEEFGRWPVYRRLEVLERVVAGLADRQEELAQAICAEAGKPIRLARVEAQRAVVTFQEAREEAKRIAAEVVTTDVEPKGEDRIGIVRRVPIGPVLGITPFNFPLNLAAHKVAPALAAGCPIILKPASDTPISALLLGEIVAGSGVPSGTISVLPCRPRVAEGLVRDPRLKLLTFTGSADVGWRLKGVAGRKRVTLELGGNAAVIVHSDADLALAVSRCVFGAYLYMGQVCISVQRIYVHRPVFDEFVEQFIAEAKQLRVGHPQEESTDVSALIREADADRVMDWVEEAKAHGARVLLGGAREAAAVVCPTLLADVPRDAKVSCLEVFGPVALVEAYDDFEEACRWVNDSEYGLQAGLFTYDARLIFHAFHTIEVGGLMVNEVSTYRHDHMPYGGVKGSGVGREGPKYAIEEMTEPRLLVLKYR